MKQWNLLKEFKMLALMWLAVILFALGAILGKCSAEKASAAMFEAAEVEASQPTREARELIAEQESRAIIEVIVKGREYEQMDYEFFRGDAEAYPAGVLK